MRNNTLIALSLTLVLQACAAVIPAHRVTDSQGNNYVFKQRVAEKGQLGPVALTSTDSTLTCEGEAKMSSQIASEGYALSGGFYVPPTFRIFLNADLPCNDGKVVRCKGERKEEGWDLRIRFYGECEHPDRGKILINGKHSQ